MWLNTNKLKSYVDFFLKRETRIALLFCKKKVHIWSYKNEYKIKYKRGSLSKKLFQKVSDSFIDHQKIYKMMKKNEKFIKLLKDFNKENWFINTQTTCFSFSINFFLKKKYFAAFEYDRLLKIKQAILLKKKYFYNSKNMESFYDISLLVFYFTRLNLILLYLSLYIIHWYFFFLCFFKLENFFKIIFFADLTFAERKDICELSNINIRGTYFFFKKESRWISNKSVLKEENLNFIYSLPLFELLKSWQTCTADYDYDINPFIMTLYFKYVWVIKLLDFIGYKKSIIKNGIKFIAFELNDFKKRNFKKNNFNYRKKTKKNKYFLFKMADKLPDFINRSVLSGFMIDRRVRFRLLLKRDEIYKGSKVLINKKEDNLYFIFLNFISFFFKSNYKISLKLLKSYELRSVFLKKKLLVIFNFLFIIYLKLKNKFFLNFDIRYLKLFCYCYFFIFQWKLKKIYLKKFILIENNILKKYKNIVINSFLFTSLLNIISTNLDYNIEINYSMRYNLLNETLYLYYKNFWRKVYKNLLEKINKYEILFSKNIVNYKFYIKNHNLLKKLYNLYLLYFYECWSLNEYSILLKTKLKIFQLIFDKLYKKKKNKTIFKFKYSIFFYKKKLKKMNSSLKFNFLKYLFSEILKFKNLNWSLYLRIYFLFKKSFIKNLFLKFFFIYFKKTDMPFYLRMFFSTSRVFSLKLARSMLLRHHIELKKLLYSLFFIYSLLNFKFYVKYFYNFPFFQNIGLLFLNKKVLFLDKTFGFKSYYSIWNKTKAIFIPSNFGEKSSIIQKMKNLEYNRTITLKNIIILEYFVEYQWNNFTKMTLFYKTFFITFVMFFFNLYLLRWELMSNFQHLGALWLKYKIIIPKLLEVSLKFIFKIQINLDFYIKIIYINHFFFLSCINRYIFTKKYMFLEWYEWINHNPRILGYKLFEYTPWLKRTFERLRYEITIMMFCVDAVFNKFIEQYNINFDNLNRNLKLLNRDIKLNLLLYDSCTVYFKNFFFKIKFLKKTDDKRLIDHMNNIFFRVNKSNIYIDTIIKKEKYCKLNIINTINIDTYNFCLSCRCGTLDSYTAKLTIIYQNLFNLDKNNLLIKKFNFKYCKICKNYKIFINDQILYIFTFQKRVLEYFYLNPSLTSMFAVVRGELLYFYKTFDNDWIVSLITHINLKKNDKVFKHFYFYINLDDKLSFNTWKKVWEKNIRFDFYDNSANFLDINMTYIKHRWLVLPQASLRKMFLLDLKKKKKIFRAEYNKREKVSYKVRRELKKQAIKDFFAEFVKQK